MKLLERQVIWEHSFIILQRVNIFLVSHSVPMYDMGRRFCLGLKFFCSFEVYFLCLRSYFEQDSYTGLTQKEGLEDPKQMSCVKRSNRLPYSQSLPKRYMIEDSLLSWQWTFIGNKGKKAWKLASLWLFT